MTTPNIEELRKLAESAKPKPIGNMTSQQEKSAHMTRHMEARMALARAMEPEHVITMCDFMQSQAERIKKLEFESSTHLRMRNLHYGENGKLRDQLAEIAATEPVLVVEKEPDYWSGGHFHEGSKPHIKPTKVWCLPIGTQLFTRPMPAKPQDHEIRELVDRPAILFKPRLFPAGDQWCALLGEDLQTGVCGFGASAGDAMRDFDKVWNTKLKAGK